ncbi:MAG: BatD family protein [Chthoniobacteraceae bacterium]
MPTRTNVWTSLLLALAAACGVFFAGVVEAAEVSASAQFSQNVTGVGEPVQLQIKINGARSGSQAPTVSVDGLRIDYLGPSQNSIVRIENGSIVSESSVTYLYQVEATRAGNFTVPALRIPVDGRILQTQPVGLTVEQGGEPHRADADPARGFLDVVLPKKTAYLGEMVPVEIRLAVDARIHWQPEAMPEISGEGFTKQKLPEPRQERGNKNGRETVDYVFRTAITPGKAGKITLGPVEVPYIAQVPRAQRNRPRSFFDDVFGDPFFAVNQRYKARADAVELEVKPLPAAGRPEGFSGAVGQFTFNASGSPNRVKLGDPVTMKLAVRGRGNFDRIEAPALRDATGWRSYPAAADFKSDDDLSTTGTKTFSMAVIPEAKKTAMPVFEFSYFDPSTEKYVVLSSEPEALNVEGTVPPPPVAVDPVEEKSDPPATPSPAPASDIVGIRYDAGGGLQSFQPLYERRGFLLAQALPLTGLLAFLVVRMRRKGEDAKRMAAAKRQKAELLARLRGRELGDQEFLETAAQVIQWETALATGHAAGSVDAAVACGSRKLDVATIDGIERIFSARAELLYAGMNEGSERLSAEERRDVLATLEKFERSPARA